jgi:hypothetical protein
LSFSFAVSGGFWRLTEGGRSPTGVSRQKSEPEGATWPIWCSQFAGARKL